MYRLTILSCADKLERDKVEARENSKKLVAFVHMRQ